MPPRLRLIRPAPFSAAVAPSLKCAPRRLLRTTAVRRADEEDDEVAYKDPMRKSVKELEFEKLKEEYFSWIKGPGANFKTPLPNETNYLGSYNPRSWERKNETKTQMLPFPLNPFFKAKSVLSDELRDEIYRRVVHRGKSIRVVSAELSISLERVVAVVRLKTIEKEMIKKKQPVATYVTKCLNSMMATTPVPDEVSRQNHENIQDAPMHPATHRQAFEPVSESRHFDHEDAAKVFGIPPIDTAVPHPSLIMLEREKNMGLNLSERKANQRARDEEYAAARADFEAKKKAKEEAALNVVDKGRYQWRFQEAKTGKIGFRYGVPHQDRKKGQVKIPRRMD